MPSFPGGMDAMKAWIYSNIKIQKGMDYKTVTEPIYVVFTVGGDGKVKNVKVMKAVSPLFDAEAIRVVSSMPDWKPGSSERETCCCTDAAAYRFQHEGSEEIGVGFS